MRDGVIIAVSDKPRLFAILTKAGRGVGMIAFRHAVARSLNLPDFFAVCCINRHHPCATGMDELQIKPARIQERRSVITEAVAEFPITFLCIKPPRLLAIKIKRHHLAHSGHGEYPLAISTRRR